MDGQPCSCHDVFGFFLAATSSSSCVRRARSDSHVGFTPSSLSFIGMSTIVRAYTLLHCFAISFAFTTPKCCERRSIELAAEASSRREFLDQASLASAGVIVSGLSVPSQAEEMVGSIDLPALGLGAWAWGDSVFWGYDKKEDDELHRVFDVAVGKLPKTLFDTAELYGLGRSETLLGKFSEDCADKVQIATKFAALPWRTKAADVVKACEASVQRLGGRPIDLYQIHFPNSWSNAEYWDGLAEAYEKGLVKAVGVSNYGSDALRACHESLAARGIPLATNQIQLSLLYKWPLQNGLLETCKELNVKVLAYSPLALGFLTGKYSADREPSGPRKKLFTQLSATPDYQDLLEVMRGIANSHEGGTLSQVAINWARAKNTVPIPGARTVKQVEQNFGALNWNLSPEEERILDEASDKVTSFLAPDASPFPKEDINTGLKLFDS